MNKPKIDKIVFTPPKRQYFACYSKNGKELCVPVIIKYEEAHLKISPVNPALNGVALEFYFNPTFRHDMNPTVYYHFYTTIPDYFLIPASFRNTRADDWSNSYHQPMSAGWLKAGRDGKLYLERDEECPMELSVADVDETLIAVATKFWEIYKKVDETERVSEFIG